MYAPCVGYDHRTLVNLAPGPTRNADIDDGWQVSRRPGNETIVEDPYRFPSGFRALSDVVHSQGLKMGLYTSRTALTCQLRPGSYLHEELDVETYCSDFAVDYVK